MILNKIETQKLLQSVKIGFKQVEDELKDEYSQIMKEINNHRMELNDILGFSDQVKGFDIEFMVDDQISFLDIYSAFLGDDYEKMKNDYRKAIEIMNETYKLKFERLELNEPVTQEEVNQVFTNKEIERMIKIHSDYIIASQNRK